MGVVFPDGFVMTNARPQLGLISPAHYTNWMPFVLINSETSLSVAARPTQGMSIALTTAVIGMFFAAFTMLIHYKAPLPGYYFAVLGIGILTTVGTPLAIVLRFHTQQRLGPLLVFDKNQKTIDLPRISRRFAVEDVECFCLVIAQPGIELEVQLQLHTHKGEAFLLVPAFTRNELEPIIKGIALETSIKAICYTEAPKTPEQWREEVINVN